MTAGSRRAKSSAIIDRRYRHKYRVIGAKPDSVYTNGPEIVNWLEKIIGAKGDEIGGAKKRTRKYRALAERRRDFRNFAVAIQRRDRVRFIAETKRASPSAGVIAAKYDPAQIARRYADAGAAAISVLTEQNYFDGKPEHLTAVHQAVVLPVLRKDFIIDEAQILESVAIGADAILLIAAAVKPAQLRALHDCANAQKMGVLVEVHTRDEIGMAVDAGAKIIGINNRNLATLEVDLTITEKLLPEIPQRITIVSESGIRTMADLKRMAACPIDALLVGEGLMRGEISLEEL